MLGRQEVPATGPQRDYVNTLLNDRAYDQAKVLEIAPNRDYSKSQAGELITYLKGCPFKPREGAKAKVSEAGMYKQGDVIYKVQKAVHGSGNLYAKKLVVSTIGESFDVSFVYAPGAINRLSAEDKLSLEDAKAFGAVYGSCCVCGRTLTDENSIAAGIGPVCAAKGWGA